MMTFSSSKQDVPIFLDSLGELAYATQSKMASVVMELKMFRSNEP